jgi:uncharacterized protein YjbJ (UPF0337 family)
MNWEQVSGQWLELKGSVREKWGKITDDDFELIAGKKDRLLGKLHTHYGLAKEDAELQIDNFISSFNQPVPKDGPKA